jgi:hypothetical protein
MRLQVEVSIDRRSNAAIDLSPGAAVIVVIDVLVLIVDRIETCVMPLTSDDGYDLGKHRILLASLP